MLGTPLHSGGLGPETFQFIEFPYGLIKDMDNNVSIIHEDPPTLAFSFDSEGNNPLFLQFFLNMGGDGFHLAVRIATANDKVVGYRRKIFHLQNDKVYGLVIEGCPGTMECFRF